MPFFAISQSDFEKAEKWYQLKNYEQAKVLFENYLFAIEVTLYF